LARDVFRKRAAFLSGGSSLDCSEKSWLLLLLLLPGLGSVGATVGGMDVTRLFTAGLKLGLTLGLNSGLAVTATKQDYKNSAKLTLYA